jgi:uncharacterized protein (DUF433 family)
MDESGDASRHLRAWYNGVVEVITKNRDILGGTPVFRGTRVPIQTLFDYLKGGETLEEFLTGFPTVSRESAVAALEEGWLDCRMASFLRPRKQRSLMFSHRRSRYRIPAKFSGPKYRNYHFPYEVEPSERPTATRVPLPCAH